MRLNLAFNQTTNLMRQFTSDFLEPPSTVNKIFSQRSMVKKPKKSIRHDYVYHNVMLKNTSNLPKRKSKPF